MQLWFHRIARLSGLLRESNVVLLALQIGGDAILEVEEVVLKTLGLVENFSPLAL